MAMQTVFNKKKLHRAYHEVFNLDSPQVCIVLNDLCKAHGVFDGGFNPDPYLNALNSGERNVILRVLTILNMGPIDIIDLSKKED